MQRLWNRRVVREAVALAVIVAAGLPGARAASSYTWVGADGGSWGAASNWDDGTGHSTGSPGANDFAQFTGFSGTVTGGVGSNTLDVGPGSSVTLDGSGFFSMVNIGQDFAFSAGDASMTVAAGQVISASTLTLGSPLGGSATFTANGTFATTGGILEGSPTSPYQIIVNNGGEVEDDANLTMAGGGLLQVGASGQMVLGNAAGTSGALTILSGRFFYGEGTIAANVIVNGTLQTFNGGNPVNKLTVTGGVSGSGVVDVVQELDINGAVGSGVTISLFANGGSNKGLLRLAEPTQEKGTLATLSTGSIIALSGLNFDDVSWSPDGLTVTGTSATLTLATTGDHSMQSFYVQPDAISGTDIVVGTVPAPTAAVWNSAAGNWSDATKWSSNPNYPNNGTPSGFAYMVTINSGAVTLDVNAKVSSLTLGGGSSAWTGLLDLTNKKLIVEAASGAKLAALSILQNQVNYGKSHPAGISSSTIPANMAIAVVDNGALAAPFARFGGLAADANSILIAPELLGDANIDGTVNFADFVVLSNHFGAANTGWAGADFNGDGVTNFADFVVLSNNFGAVIGGGFTANEMGQPFDAAAVVPEPATLLSLGLGALGIVAGRRRVRCDACGGEQTPSARQV